MLSRPGTKFQAPEQIIPHESTPFFTNSQADCHDTGHQANQISRKGLILNTTPLPSRDWIIHTKNEVFLVELSYLNQKPKENRMLNQIKGGLKQNPNEIKQINRTVEPE